MFGPSSFPQSRFAGPKPENLSQNALAAVTGNLCFIAFVIGVIIFTITAATYEPTFKSDIGYVKTGEEFVASNQTAFEAFINITDIDFEDGAGPDKPIVVSENRDCKIDDPIDCRDPDLFHLLMRATIEKFKDVHFYRFGKPVQGDNDTSCHMAWRYRPNEGKTAASSKDYRSFIVSRSENCSVNIVSVGEYHSGGNARKRKEKGKKKGSDQKVFDKMSTMAGDNDDDNNHNFLSEIGETVTDELSKVSSSKVVSENSFSSGKYLIYTGGGDRCKSMRQYLWSFTCMLGEAQYLNRTLVMDLSICLSKIYSSSGVDEEGKDFRFYFDFEHLKDSASVRNQVRFWSDWNKRQEKDKLSIHLVEDFRVRPTKLAEVKDSLIMRKFGSVEPDNYWYRVCEVDPEPVIQRPWHMIWKSRRLLDVATGIASRMNWDFDSVRVERGGKASNKESWPNLDRDTKLKALAATLEDKIEDGRDVYISTNEVDVSIFDPLKKKYSTHFLDYYKDLWDVNSDWYDEMTKLNSGNLVEFDGYMRISVDTEVFLRGKRQIDERL